MLTKTWGNSGEITAFCCCSFEVWFGAGWGGRLEGIGGQAGIIIDCSIYPPVPNPSTKPSIFDTCNTRAKPTMYNTKGKQNTAELEANTDAN